MVMIIFQGNTYGCDFIDFNRCRFGLDSLFCERLDSFEKQNKDNLDIKRVYGGKITLKDVNSIMYSNIQKELARRAIAKVNEASVGLNPLYQRDNINEKCKTYFDAEFDSNKLSDKEIIEELKTLESEYISLRRINKNRNNEVYNEKLCGLIEDLKTVPYVILMEAFMRLRRSSKNKNKGKKGIMDLKSCCNPKLGKMIAGQYSKNAIENKARLEAKKGRIEDLSK